VQEVIVRYFVDTKYNKESLLSAPLGTLLVRPPSLRVGGSELDSFRFSLILIEIMHLLLRFGFYYSESLLVELMHTVFGILSSHKYGAGQDQFDFEAAPESLDTDSDASAESSHIELSPVSNATKETPTSQNTTGGSDDSLINWITNPDNNLNSKVHGRSDSTKLANDLRDSESRAPIPSVPKQIFSAASTGNSNRVIVPLVKSEELIRICRRHDSVFANKLPTEDEKKEVEVLEHQL
jgi:hypothetical protein